MFALAKGVRRITGYNFLFTYRRSGDDLRNNERKEKICTFGKISV
jgi:hypothetical protein